MSSPKKFTSLHSHSGFSTFDGLGYPQEHIDFILKNGMDSWCLTEHGHMNSFPHAWLYAQQLKKAGADFKLVPGCEFYVHPDLNSWRSDMEIAQDKRRKASLERAANKGKRSNVQIITDDEDDVMDVKVAAFDDESLDEEDKGLTVEKEEDSKSGRLSNPIHRRHHLVVLPKNSKGLETVFNLVSRGYKEGYYRFPRIDYGMLKEHAKGNLIASTACLAGPIAYDIFNLCNTYDRKELINFGPSLMEHPEFKKQAHIAVENVYEQLAWALGEENVYLELQFNRLPAQHLVNMAILKYAAATNRLNRLVVTADSHYPDPSSWREREIYRLLGYMKTDKRDVSPDDIPTYEQLKCDLFPKNADQMWEEVQFSLEKYAEYLDIDNVESVISAAIERTHEIVHDEISDLTVDTKMKLPSGDVPKDKTPDQFLSEMVQAGLKVRGVFDKPEYQNRVKYELEIISQKGFANYFITLAKIIRIAKANMLVGPGRGSAAGSLVVYALEITDVDPIRYDLSFERFLNPAREGYPDIDVDVSDRERMLELLREEYGDESIIAISNYNTFKIKNLTKDLSRLYGIDFQEVNTAMKGLEDNVFVGLRKDGVDVENKAQYPISIAEARKYHKPFDDLLRRTPQMETSLLSLAKQITALGRHAGGVIICDRVLERMPVISAKPTKSGGPRVLQTPWTEGATNKHLEVFGWIKYDLLALKTLRYFERTIRRILQSQGNAEPTFSQINEWYRDNLAPGSVPELPEVFENVYHKGRFPGIFQCTSTPAQKFFQGCQPNSVEEFTALTSIFRPGPLAANVDKIYQNAKNNPTKIDYKHPLIKKVLEPTYGCIVYQEQLMKLCEVVAGFPSNETDTVRRNILKRSASKAGKQSEELKQMRDQFVSGSVGNGVDKNVANELWDNIVYFAGYGFNKSHALSYAFISYQCAYLFTKYPFEWCAAILDESADDIKETTSIQSEVKKSGLLIGNVDINKSMGFEWTFESQNKTLFPSLQSVKGIGAGAIAEIVEIKAQMARPFRTVEDVLFDESGKWRWSKFNKACMEALIMTRGLKSLDDVGSGREWHKWSLIHKCVVENWEQLRKVLKKNTEKCGAPLLRNLNMEHKEIPEFKRGDMIAAAMKYLGTVPDDLILSPKNRKYVENNSLWSVDRVVEAYHQLKEMGEADDPNCPLEETAWFMVQDVTVKKSKNGKEYLLVMVMGPKGYTHRMYMWNYKKDKDHKPEVWQPYCAKITVDSFGLKCWPSDLRTFD